MEIFTFFSGKTLHCYQCTKGEFSRLEAYMELPECFDMIENPICEAFEYCVKMTIKSE